MKFIHYSKRTLYVSIVGMVSILIFVGVLYAPAPKHEDPVNDIDSTYYGVINGYHFYEDTGPRCLVVIGDIIYDHHNFGYYNSGCDATLDWIGYTVMKDGEEYSLQELVEDGELSACKVYRRIHFWNDNKPPKK